MNCGIQPKSLNVTKL